MGFGKDNKGVILRTRMIETLAALADNAIEEITTGKIVPTEDFRMIKTEIYGSMEMVSEAGIHGALLVLANGELSSTEVVEALNAIGPTGPQDRAIQERAERYVKVLGTFKVLSDASLAAVLTGSGGEAAVKETIRWTFYNPEGWDLYIYNNTGVTMGTGNIVNLICTHYGVWVT